MSFTILVWFYCLRILVSCKTFNFSSWERWSSYVLTVIPVLSLNVSLNVSSKFPLPSNYDSFMTETEKVVATHSSTFSWKIPWLEEPGGLQSMGSLSWTWLSDFTFTLLEKQFESHCLAKKYAASSLTICLHLFSWPPVNKNYSQETRWSCLGSAGLVKGGKRVS